MPGRLWLGTFDAAMLANAGPGAGVGFSDSALLLPPCRRRTPANLADVRRAAAEAVEDLQRREALLES